MKINTREDALRILGFNQPDTNPTDDEIKAAYKRLAKQVHPDIGGTDELFRLLNQAYGILTGAADAHGPETNGQDAGRQTADSQSAQTGNKRGPRSRMSILNDPGFVMPGKDFIHACLGPRQYVEYDGTTISVSWMDIMCQYVRSRFYVRYHVRFYKNWFAYVTDTPYTETSSDNQIQNREPFSTRFNANVTIDTKKQNPKYFRLYVDIPDALCSTGFEGKFEHSMTLERTIRDRLCNKLAFEFHFTMT